jgi:hypothetical protein
MGPLRDPDLPIDLFRPEGEVVAFSAPDYPAPKVLHVGNRRHQLFVRIRHQQIRRWNGPVVFVPQFVDQMIDRAGRFDLSIEVCVLAK